MIKNMIIAIEDDKYDSGMQSHISIRSRSLIISNSNELLSDKFKDKTKTGLYDAKVRLGDLKNVGVFEFGSEDIVRNPIITQILKRYD